MIIQLNFEVKQQNLKQWDLINFLGSMIGHGITALYSIVNSSADNGTTYILQYESEYSIEHELSSIRCLCIAFEQNAIAGILTAYQDTFLQFMIGRYGSDISSYCPFDKKYFVSMDDIDSLPISLKTCYFDKRPIEGGK